MPFLVRKKIPRNIKGWVDGFHGMICPGSRSKGVDTSPCSRAIHRLALAWWAAKAGFWVDLIGVKNGWFEKVPLQESN